MVSVAAAAVGVVALAAAAAAATSVEHGERSRRVAGMELRLDFETLCCLSRQRVPLLRMAPLEHDDLLRVGSNRHGHPQAAGAVPARQTEQRATFTILQNVLFHVLSGSVEKN